MSLAGPIRACVFDAYGTLMDLSSVKEDFQVDLGDKAEGFFRDWRRRQLEISWLPRPGSGRADFWRVTEEALEETMAHFRVDASRLQARLMQSWLEPTLYSDVIPCLLHIRAGGMKTAILSNGTRRMLDQGLGHARLDGVLDQVLSVEKIGVFKPDPSVYHMVLETFGVSASSVCYVSGNAWDVTGAAASGFQVVWLNRSGERAENPPRGTAAIIASLADLPPLLGV